MKKFVFGGMGYYSDSFGWDTGLTCEIISEEQFTLPNVSHMGTFGQEQELAPFKEGVHITTADTYGGTRKISGYIIAANVEAAERHMKDYANEFRVIPYRGQ